MRGIGTLFAGMVVLVALVAITAYIVHVYNVGLEALREQQMLYEKARYLAEHANMSGGTVELPAPADIIVIDPNGVPHVAKDVTRVVLPWPASQSKIFVAVPGHLRAAAADPVAVALSSAASVAAAPLLPSANSSAAAAAWDCSGYLDPLLYHAAIDSGMSELEAAETYRGYIPEDQFNLTYLVYLRDPFYVSPLPTWDTVLQTYGINVTSIIYRGERQGSYLYKCRRPYIIAWFGSHLVALVNGTRYWNWFGLWRVDVNNILCVYNGTLLPNGTLVLDFQGMLPRYEDGSQGFYFSYGDAEINALVDYSELYDFGGLWYSVDMTVYVEAQGFNATAVFSSSRYSLGWGTRVNTLKYTIGFGSGVTVIADPNGLRVANTYSGSAGGVGSSGGGLSGRLLVIHYRRC